MGKLLLAALLLAACATTPGGEPDGRTPATAGKALYERSCQKCHALYMPRSHTAAEWRFFVRKYGRKARLSTTEKARVYRYLSRNARPE